MRALILLGALMFGSPASADAVTADDVTAFDVTAGNEAHAARQLRMDPDDHVALARLARIYLKTGRTVKAQRLYKQLLSMEDVTLDRADGASVSSRRLAADALRHAASPRPVQLSARSD